VRVLNVTQNTLIADNARLADTFISRLVGLLNRSSLEPNEALIITRCQSIHMLFMRFAIDVIFTDRNFVVVGLSPHIKPFRLSPLFLNAYYAVEAPQGTITLTHTRPGDQLKLDKFA